MSAAPPQRQAGRFRLRRRRPHRDEEFIWRYPFPEVVEARCRHNHPELSDREWQLVEEGLREWFLCCAWREGEVLGMPSRLVDEAWHEFILDSRAWDRVGAARSGDSLPSGCGRSRRPIRTRRSVGGRSFWRRRMWRQD